MIEKLKQRWGINSNWQLSIIILVFSITGSFATKMAAPLTEFIGVTKEMGWYFYWPLRIAIIFPLYQIFLVIFGWLFGQHTFFWKFEKKMIRRMRLGFLLKRIN